MSKLLPISPSSLNLFKQCPKKYFERYIAKSFKPSISEALTYGNLIHEGLEHRVKHGTDLLSYYKQKAPGLGLVHCESKFENVVANTHKFLDNLDRMMDGGWQVYVEMEAATDGQGGRVLWWDKNCFMRAKIDVFMISPDRSDCIIIDWKTGKGSSINPYQLDFIGMTLVPEFGIRKYSAIDFLVDSGEIRKFKIDVDVALPKHISIKECVNSKMLPTIQAIKDLQAAYLTDEWVAKSNRFCNWCEISDKCSFSKQ